MIIYLHTATVYQDFLFFTNNFESILIVDETLTGTKSVGQSGTGSNGNEE